MGFLIIPIVVVFLTQVDSSQIIELTNFKNLFSRDNLYLILLAISIIGLLIWLTKNTLKKQKRDYFLEPLERLQWIIDNYDKPI